MIPNVDVNTNANIKSVLLYPFVSCELGIQVNCLQEHHVPRQVEGRGGGGGGSVLRHGRTVKVHSCSHRESSMRRG